MHESFYKYMKVGIIHFMAYPTTMKGEGPILETITKIAEDDFFTAIEITRIKDPDVRAKAKEIITAAGLAVGFGAQPVVLGTPLNPNSLDEDERKKAVEVLKECVDEAQFMGAERMAFLSGKDPEDDDDREYAFDALVKTTRELCDYAEIMGMGITLETFDQDIDKKALIGPSYLAADLADAVNRRNFGLMVDLSHMPLLEETPEECAWYVKDHLVHLHVGNCVMKEGHVAYGDAHPRFGIEDGENDVYELAEFLKAFMDIGFLNGIRQPFLSFEVKPLPNESSEIVIANAKRALRQAWAMI